MRNSILFSVLLFEEQTKLINAKNLFEEQQKLKIHTENEINDFVRLVLSLIIPFTVLRKKTLDRPS